MTFILPQNNAINIHITKLSVGYSLIIYAPPVENFGKVYPRGDVKSVSNAPTSRVIFRSGLSQRE